MIKRHLVAVSIILTCTSALSTDQYPSLTHNYDSVLQANINDLRKDFVYIDDDLYSMYLKDTGQKYNSTPKKVNDLDGLIITSPEHFTKAADHLDLDVIKKTGYIEDGAYTVLYILKDEVDQAVKQNGLQCIYKTRIRSDYGGFKYDNLHGLKDPYIKHMTKAGYNVKTFINKSDLLGFTKTKNGYSDGMLNVLVNNKVITLMIHDCKKQGDDQIIRDLTEWSNLLIKAN